MRKLRSIVEAVDFATVFGNASERDDVVKIHTKVCVDVVNESFNILLRGLVERNDGESRTTTTERLEDALIVFDRLAAVARSRDDDVSTARQETLDDLNTDGAFANTSQQSILVLKRGTRGGDFVENVEINTSQIAAVFPVRADFAL
jgi:hypothetical protein